MIDYQDSKLKKRASTKLSLALVRYEAAETLIEAGKYGEAISLLYFCCFYLSQSVCADVLKNNPSHRNVEFQLNNKYGRGGGEIPRRYVKLHNELHQERENVDYRRLTTPSKDSVDRFHRILTSYVKCVSNNLVKASTFDVISDLYRKNIKEVKDFSYDIFCPKTYSHHNRITFWQPPFYLKVYSPDELMKAMRPLLRKLDIRKSDNYVLGLNSRVDQYSNNHYLMLDFDSLDTEIESPLDGISSGVLLKSGRGYHFIGSTIIKGQANWEKEMRRIGRMKKFKDMIDQNHIEISIRRGYSTLRLTSSPIKPYEPIFYKEI